MAIISREEAQALMKKALGFSKADECEINLNGSDGGNIRYARNAVSTSLSVAANPQQPLAITRMPMPNDSVSTMFSTLSSRVITYWFK